MNILVNKIMIPGKEYIISDSIHEETNKETLIVYSIDGVNRIFTRKINPYNRHWVCAHCEVTIVKEDLGFIAFHEHICVTPEQEKILLDKLSAEMTKSLYKPIQEK